MTEADVIIMGSPTYSADVSSTLKAVIERASVVSDTNPGMFSHKIGAGIAVGRRGGTMNALDTINRYLDFFSRNGGCVGQKCHYMAETGQSYQHR